MSRISDKIRAYVNDLSVSDHFGAWGILRPDQRRQIRELCDTCDMFEKTADELARKQSEGEWIDQYNGKYANPIYVCSLCGKGTLLTPYINELNNMEMTQALSPFCPNCGAKMNQNKN